MDNLVIEQKLLRAAIPGWWQIEAVLLSVYIWLRQIADSEEDVKPAGIERWITTMQGLYDRFEKAKNDADELRRIEIEAVSNTDVREALEYLKDSQNDKRARVLLHAGSKTHLFYDGDAAKELLERFAKSCDEPYRSALLWLATQKCARHAFAAANSAELRNTGTHKKDFSKLPEPKGSWVEREYDRYSRERVQLFVADFKKRNGREMSFDYTFRDKDYSKADKLFRKKCKAEGMSPTAIRQMFYRFRHR